MKLSSGGGWPLALLLGTVCVPGVLLTACGPRPVSSGATAAAKANARCTECHLDFLEEGLTLTHQRAGVPCVRCHGHSQPHIDDEVRKTKADVTFRGPAMKVFCLTCHDPRDHHSQADHAANATLPPARRKACTQCHGEHELLRL
jgi:hypothetical protein